MYHTSTTFSSYNICACVFAGGDIGRQRHQLSGVEWGDLLHRAVSSSGSANQSPDSWWCQDGRCCPSNTLPGPAADFWSHQEWYSYSLFVFFCFFRPYLAVMWSGSHQSQSFIFRGDAGDMICIYAINLCNQPLVVCCIVQIPGFRQKCVVTGTYLCVCRV